VSGETFDDTEVQAALGKIEDLTGAYVVTIAPAPTESTRREWHMARNVSDPSDATNVAILGWLEEQGRDFAAVTPKMERAVGDALEGKVEELLARNLPIASATDSIGLAVKDAIVDRFNGQDVRHMRRLRRVTTRRKGHGRIGVESGALRDGVTNAVVETRRV
jgi:hypothetical protein